MSLQSSTNGLNSSEGYLEVNVGPMFSGKTTLIVGTISAIADMPSNHLKTCLISFLGDEQRDTTSNNHGISSHSTLTNLSPSITIFKTDTLQSIEEEIKYFDIIGIDEGQFFHDITRVVYWVNDLKKKVYVSALDGDFKQELFGNVCQLLPKADSFQKRTAICNNCFISHNIMSNAPFTHKKDGDPLQVLEIGGSDKYEPVCRKCLQNYY